ncbi:MAG: hypothetical protein HEQ10_01865 [Dolichospermum sp. DEX182a]|jgi:hypothetical protein|nr:hypothetical protein [Dolichospermum sp. DEX182a]QSV62202.1 MAG: hypothetical protein HEQ26_04950 [Dolichospermum sp. DL01]
MKNFLDRYGNFIISLSALGFMGIMTGCLDMRISFQSTNPETTPSMMTNSSKNGDEINLDSTPSDSVESSPQKNQSTVVAYQVNSDSKNKASGLLRISNKTTQPVRLALLARQSSLKSATANKSKSDIPAHWDFAPEEGSESGLVLSLPQANLRLEKGDILVAFAQDGSRRYWGPYVVGETSSPQWNPQTQEWQLVLQNR